MPMAAHEKGPRSSAVPFGRLAPIGAGAQM